VALLNDGDVTPDVANRWSCSNGLLAVVAEDLAAGALGEGVVEDDEALVLRAHGEHLVRLALPLQLLGGGDHLVPGLRRLGHEVLAVPEQLHVGVLRRAVELVLVAGGLQGAGEGAPLDLGLVLAGPLQDPVGAGELLGPGDVEAEHVHAAVLRGEPADELHPLVVRLPRQHPVGDLVAPLGLRVAVVDDLLQVLLRRVVQVDRGRTAVPAGAAGRRHRRHQRQRRGGRHRAHAWPPSTSGLVRVAHQSCGVETRPFRAGRKRRSLPSMIVQHNGPLECEMWAGW
jgi:hypothetical protein